MLLALSSGQKTGLALVGGAFIVFAVVSALWIPRYRPDFPGRGLRLFIGVTVLFTVGMLAAVVGFGKEPKEKGTTGATPTTVTAPTTATTTKTAGTTTAPPPPAKGDPVAGKAVFAANGCASCHTYAPAGAQGKVGPDLSHLAADAQKANRGSLDQYIHESIVDPSAYTVPGFPQGVMPPFSGLSGTQIADLAAFLTRGS